MKACGESWRESWICFALILTGQILKKLVQEIGKTIVIVLHDINFAASYADEIIAMKDGQLFTQGTTQEMIKKDVLDELYEMDIRICEIEGRRFCLYF